MGQRGTAARVAHLVLEFSDSYHLLSPDPGDGAHLLRAAGRFGAVFPAAGRFLTFLVEGCASDFWK